MGSAGDNRGALHVSVAPVNQTSSHFKFPEPKRTVLVPLESAVSDEEGLATPAHTKKGKIRDGIGNVAAGGVAGSGGREHGEHGEDGDDASHGGLSDKQLAAALQNASARKALSKQRRVREATTRKAAKVAKAQEAQRRRALKVAQEERRAKHDAAAVANAKNFSAAAAAVMRQRSSGKSGAASEMNKTTPQVSLLKQQQASSSGALPPQRLWMWKHIPGSAISIQAGLTPFVVPAAGPPPPGAPSSKYTMRVPTTNGSGEDVQRVQRKREEGGEKNGQSYFFFHKPSLAAHPFSPPPLPALVPPRSLASVYQSVMPPGGGLASCGVLTPELWDHAWPSDGHGVGDWTLHSGGVMDFAASAWALVGHESIGSTQANEGKGESSERRGIGAGAAGGQGASLPPTSSAERPLPSSSSAFTESAPSAEDTELLAVAVGKGTVRGGLPPRAISVIMRGPRTPPQEWLRSNAIAAVLEANVGPPVPLEPAPKQQGQFQQQQQPLAKPWRLIDDGLFAPRLKENVPEEIPTICAIGGDASTGVALMSAAAHAAAAPAGLFDGPRVEARAVLLDWRRLLSSRRFYECFEPPPCVAPPVPRNAVEAKENSQRMKSSSSLSQQHSAHEALTARVKLSAQLKALEDAVVDNAGVSILCRLFYVYA